MTRLTIAALTLAAMWPLGPPWRCWAPHRAQRASNGVELGVMWRLAMRKMPTIFQRDWTGDRSQVTPEQNPACAWVFAGEGLATQKLDGTSCLIQGGKLFRRREIKHGRNAPVGFVEADRDLETGKIVGWMPVGPGPEDATHREAFNPGDNDDGTYELIGPKVQGNPEMSSLHVLVPHKAAKRYPDAPQTFGSLRDWLTGQDIEGLVWHHPDGRMAKIKLRDFGLKREVRDAP